MQIKQLAKLCLFGAVCAFSSTEALAGGCEREPSVPTEQLYMDIGKIVVQPDAPIGTVLYSKTWTFNSSGKASYYCDTDDNKLVGSLVNPGADLGNNVHATNIRGIGLRMYREGSTVKMYYPGSVTVGRGRLALEGSTFTLEVVKTENTTGSGVLSSGKYSTYDLEGGSNPILETYVSADAFSIVSPSCMILSNRTMNVNMGEVNIGDFSGVGSTVGNKPFNIELQCTGGSSEAGMVNIHTSFSGHLPAGLGNDKGVLVNEYGGKDAAEGVGIQVLKDDHPVGFNQKYLVGKVIDNIESRINVPLTARYYQYGDKITSGNVTSHMVYNIDYD